MGTLVVQLDYHKEFTFYMTVMIPELRLTEEINFTGKRYQVPPGTYTVVLKGLMGDPRYAGPKYAAFGTAYGSFERTQKVEVRANREAVCRFAFMGDVEHVTVQVVANGEPVTGAEDFSLARQFGRRTTVVFRDGEIQNGYTLPEHSEYPHFFLFPVDPNSNIEKVYVIREATREIRLL